MDTAAKIIKLGPDRAMTRDLLTVAASQHTIHGLVETDVSEPRRRLGDTSLTAFLIHCFASTLAAQPHINSMRRGRRLYCFREVNVGTMVEREEDGRKVTAGLIVRDAAGKSVRAIHDEIRSAQREAASRLAVASGAAPFLWMPGFVRRAALRYIQSRPETAHRMGLVAGVSAVGMFSHSGGWGIPLTPSTVMLTVGGIARRPVLVDGRIEEHEFLSLTFSFNHDIVDGAPAARFAEAVSKLIEAADGLERDSQFSTETVEHATKERVLAKTP